VPSSLQLHVGTQHHREENKDIRQLDQSPTNDLELIPILEGDEKIKMKVKIEKIRGSEKKPHQGKKLSINKIL